ncbi:hypothetical protein, partial [Neorhizobium galegae]|uniref:hypothetical protein n=1 Tax=Neorhizobium galegae TaxID=399 RepID=UPI00210714A4
RSRPTPILEVILNVWRFLGAGREPAPDCKTPLDHINPHFADPEHPSTRLDIQAGMNMARRGFA